MTWCRNLVSCTYTGPDVLRTWWCQFQLVIAKVQVQVRKQGGIIEFVYNITQCRYNCVYTWYGFIGFPHLHIQSYFINRPFQSYFNRWIPTGRLVYLPIMSSAISFSSSTSSLGLLWGCATGSIAGSTSKSTCTPFIFPIPLKRSAYSPTSFLIAVSFNWTEFATSTRPRSLAVWNPINGSVFVHPFMTCRQGYSLARFNHHIEFFNHLQWHHMAFICLKSV